MSRPALAERLADLAIGADEVLDRFVDWVAELGLDLYPAQQEALLELWAGRHVILETPTGSGKSLVALGLHFRALCQRQRSFYTAPVKALVSEKFFALCEDLGPEAVGMLTGDASINRDAPVLCCTAEVLANMALREGPTLDAPVVVMDEFHYYGDPERGAAWQIPLLVLRATQFLLMSATLGDTGRIARHVERDTGRGITRVHSDERPVPLDYEYRETPIHETVETLLQQGRAPIYIVHFTQRACAEQAQGLTSARVTGAAEKRELDRRLASERFDTPYGAEVRRFLRHGIGIHHAGLLPRYRLLVEQLAQQGLLKVICGTDTLGVGVNIPIRTVLFSRLCKYDGRKVAILTARDFKQIAGRAGRRGFDDRGSVVVQAPEHVIENLRLARAGKKKAPRRRPPGRGFVAWNRETFERLIERPPERLEPQFDVDHGLIVNVMQRRGAKQHPCGGYRNVLALIERCHLGSGRKARLRREAARRFRSLRRAGIVQRVYDPELSRHRVRVDAELQWDFSLHHTLALFLVEAVGVLDPEHERYALDVLALAEAILEDPEPVLRAQAERERRELLARLKAARVPYEERLRKLEEVTHPKPDAPFLYQTFDLFAEAHPWVAQENVRPKAVARQIFEDYWSFAGFVREYGLQRCEGLLLRYLGQVYHLLQQSVPERARTEAVVDAISFFRTLLARVDSSLLDEWESRRGPAPAPGTAASPADTRPALDVRSLRARVRAELHALVRALAVRDYEEAVGCVAADEHEPWDATRFADALTPFFQEYERLVFEPRARLAEYTLLEPTQSGRWNVTQVLLDPQDDNLWCIQGWVEVADPLPDTPLVHVRRIGT